MKKEEKTLHELFDFSIVLKGIHALIEIISGTSIFLVSSSLIFKFVNAISFGELTEQPIDSMSQYLLNLTHSFSGGTKQFVALYLLSHGIINLIIIIELFRKKIWAYYASFIVLTVFSIYQIYRYIYNPNIFLILLTILDVVTMWLIWREYKRIKNSY
ncbi:MAG: DUF2127 domain-containing protein [Candidatus Pacebacteria bacterium]|nr:DUF2127 domain-containing protein [Candidatus Paceibacterota bacterium]